MCFVMILDLTVEIIGNLMIKEERSGKYLYRKSSIKPPPSQISPPFSEEES